MVNMRTFALIAQAVAATTKRREKVRLVADYLRSLPLEEAERAAVELVSGLNSPMTEADVNLFNGWAYIHMGDAGKGLEYAQRAIGLEEGFDLL